MYQRIGIPRHRASRKICAATSSEAHYLGPPGAADAPDYVGCCVGSRVWCTRWMQVMVEPVLISVR
jgi:hypothetical protein